MARKVHAVGTNESTECKIQLASFPRMVSTTDVTAVTCNGCLGAIKKRTEAVARLAMGRSAAEEPPQLDLMTRRDLADLKAFIEASLFKLGLELRHPPLQRYMGVDECAAYIGRSPKAVRRLANDRAIPHSRFDRKLTFDREKIDRWMERRSMRVLSIRS